MKKEARSYFSAFKGINGTCLNNPELLDFAGIRSDADTDGFYKQLIDGFNSG